jgi:hypothetical protein
MNDDAPNATPQSPAPIRARRWTRPPPVAARSNRLAWRLIGIPAAAIAGVFVFRGLQDRYVLPDCDSERARHTLADMLAQLKLEPVTFAPVKTVSATKDEVVCSAALPLPDGGTVAVDYRFYWDGGKANMQYSVVRQPPKSS